MRLFRTFGLVLSFGFGVFLFVPLAVVAWEMLLSPGHRETFASVIVAGHELTGWHMWSFVGSLAVIGAMLILLGIYVLHSRKSAAQQIAAGNAGRGLQFRFAVHAGWSRVPELWTLGIMRRALRYFGYVIAGLSFWIPSILVHAVRARNLGASHLDMLAILILPLVAALLVWELLHRWSGTQRGTVAAWMLLGIWIFGPLCITVSSTFSGGGFAQAQAWHLLLLGIPLFLPMTFMMSTYDGTLGALAVVTLWFVISSFIGLLWKRPPKQSPPVM